VSDAVEITVLGRPVSWKRAQRNPMTGAIYVDKDSENYRAIIREAARGPMRDRSPFDGPVELSVIAVFQIPRSWPKYRIAQATAGCVPCTASIDLDNVIKALKDSLTGVVYRDDRLVASYGACSKIYGYRPRLEVRIAPIAVKAAVQLGRPLEHEPDLFAQAAQ
jgi:Holliday junction resolvase RusA-like endonuclease